MNRVFIGHNFFGAGNFGDDLMLAGFLDVAARYPGVEISVCTPHDLASQQHRFPQLRWLPEGDAARNGALRASDVWLGLGDTPFQLDSGPWLLDHNERERQRCAGLGKPMYLLGVGCESAAAAADPRARALLAAAERVWTRDEQSAATLRPYIDATRLSIGADVAHLAFAGERPEPAPDAGVVGLVLAFERREQFDLDELEIFLGLRARGSTRWLVQEVRALPYLERWILANLSPEARARLSVMDLDYTTSSVEDYLRAFGTPDVTVTSRYHAAVVAAWNGSRVLVVSRSAKLQGIAQQLGLPQIAGAGSHAALEAALETAAAVPRERLRDLHARANAMCEAFFDECIARRGAVARTTTVAGTASLARSDPLPPHALRATIEVDLPRSMRLGETIIVRCTVTNRGDATYVSAQPHPVELCYRWYDADGAACGAGTWVHTPLPLPLGPGKTTELPMRIGPPPAAGSYTLAVTLLQEGIAWFDDVDSANGVRDTVSVAEHGGDAEIEAFYQLPPAERRALTLHAIETGTPLMVRWGRTYDIWRNEWGYRAALAAAWVSTARSVADLGCGAMTVERYLLPSQKYVPVDLVARDDRTIVLDLEKDDLSVITAEACVLLGVIHYLFDLPAFLTKLPSRFARIVVSYTVDSAGDIDSRLAHGWVNHYTYDELVAIFRQARLTVVRESFIEDGQHLFELVPAE